MECSNLRFVVSVLVRMLIVAGCIVAGATAAMLAGPAFWRGRATSFDMVFGRMEREWLIGGVAGAAIGCVLAYRLRPPRDDAGARLGQTALAVGLLLALWFAVLMG